MNDDWLQRAANMLPRPEVADAIVVVLAVVAVLVVCLVGE